MNHLERLLENCQRYVNAGLPIPLDLAVEAMDAGIILDQLNKED